MCCARNICAHTGANVGQIRQLPLAFNIPDSIGCNQTVVTLLESKSQAALVFHQSRPFPLPGLNHHSLKLTGAGFKGGGRTRAY